jgi:hypothetical protein
MRTRTIGGMSASMPARNARTSPTTIATKPKIRSPLRFTVTGYPGVTVLNRGRKKLRVQVNCRPTQGIVLGIQRLKKGTASAQSLNPDG